MRKREVGENILILSFSLTYSYSFLCSYFLSTFFLPKGVPLLACLFEFELTKSRTASCCYREKGIAPMGYCPLARCRKFEQGAYPTIDNLSAKYNKTKAQIVLRWAVQSGFITIPKSSNEGRLKENAALFDWTLLDEEMQQIDDFRHENGN